MVMDLLLSSGAEQQVIVIATDPSMSSVNCPQNVVLKAVCLRSFKCLAFYVGIDATHVAT